MKLFSALYTHARESMTFWISACHAIFNDRGTQVEEDNPKWEGRCHYLQYRRDWSSLHDMYDPGEWHTFATSFLPASLICLFWWATCSLFCFPLGTIQWMIHWQCQRLTLIQATALTPAWKPFDKYLILTRESSNVFMPSSKNTLFAHKMLMAKGKMPPLLLSEWEKFGFAC